MLIYNFPYFFPTVYKKTIISVRTIHLDKGYSMVLYFFLPTNTTRCHQKMHNPTQAHSCDDGAVQYRVPSWNFDRAYQNGMNADFSPPTSSSLSGLECHFVCWYFGWLGRSMLFKVFSHNYVAKASSSS